MKKTSPRPVTMLSIDQRQGEELIRVKCQSSCLLSIFHTVPLVLEFRMSYQRPYGVIANLRRLDGCPWQE